MNARGNIRVGIAAACALAWHVAGAQTVKITPLGSHTGELCDRDRAPGSS
jgi:hypothetical protein